MALGGKVLATFLLVPSAAAFEVAAGFGAVEEGDDRIRPGLGLHMGFGDALAGRVNYYGREFGPVREESNTASFMRRWSIFKSNTVTAGFGGALMDERTTLTFEDEETGAGTAGEAAASEANTSEDNFNLGAVLGLSWSLPKSASPLYATVSWDAHIFPAGAGGLFLSTGRKQTIMLMIGAQVK